MTRKNRLKKARIYARTIKMTGDKQKGKMRNSRMNQGNRKGLEGDGGSV